MAADTLDTDDQDDGKEADHRDGLQRAYQGNEYVLEFLAGDAQIREAPSGDYRQQYQDQDPQDSCGCGESNYQGLHHDHPFFTVRSECRRSTYSMNSEVLSFLGRGRSTFISSTTFAGAPLNI